MTATTPTHVDSSIPEVWAQDVLRRSLVEGFWPRFIGGPGSPIVRKMELHGGPGDLIHIQVTDPLTGAGVSGDTATLEGNEENLASSDITTSPVLYRHAVRVNRRAARKSIIDLSAEASNRLQEWAWTKQDTVRWAAFTGTTAPVSGQTYTPNDYGMNGHVTKNTTVLGDTLSTYGLQAIKLKLQNNHAKPIMVDGHPHYILATHPNVTFQLKQEARYETWVQQAAVKGDTNPFFRGALCVVDGMIIHEHENCPRSVNGSSIQVATSLAFGNEFGVEAVDEETSSVTKTFDYDLEWGISLSFAFQARRALELSSLRVFLSAPTV